jgi:hypothetical protein
MVAKKSKVRHKSRHPSKRKPSTRPKAGKAHRKTTKKTSETKKAKSTKKKQAKKTGAKRAKKSAVANRDSTKIESMAKGHKKKARTATRPPPPKPNEPDYILNALRRYETDLKCIKELAFDVPPALAKRSELLSKRLMALVGIKKDGKYTFKSDAARTRFLEIAQELARLMRGNQMFRENTIVGIVARFEELTTSVATAYFKSNYKTLATKEKITQLLFCKFGHPSSAC